MFEHKFVPLEKLVFDENIRDELALEEEYKGHIEIDYATIDDMGQNNWELVHVIFVDGVQHGWFKRHKVDL